MANTRLTFEDSEAPEVLQHLQKPINIAASKGDVEYVKQLLTHGANPNDKDIYGRTPLHYAVNNKHAEVLHVLLENGADVTCTTNKGRTPLHTASYNGWHYASDLLNHVSSDKLNDFVNTKDIYNGNTALHVAVKGGYMDLVELLLQNGATYNALNNQGQVPIDLSKDEKISNTFKLIEELYREFEYGNVEAIEKLLGEVKPNELFCITNTQNSQGHTLLQVAENEKLESIAEALLMLKQLYQSREEIQLAFHHFTSRILLGIKILSGHF